MKNGKNLPGSGVATRDIGFAGCKNPGTEIPAGLIGKNQMDLIFKGKEAAKKRSIGVKDKSRYEKKFRKMVVSNPEYPCGFIGMNPNNFRGAQ